MAKLPEVRKYQRILPSKKSIDKLEEQGFEWVMSSNVSGAKDVNGDLFVRFHNGSIYKYKNRGDQFTNLIAASSKGKWVWRNLKRAGVSYKKVGSLPLPEDKIVPDSEIIRPQGEYEVKAELPTFEELEQGALPRISIKKISDSGKFIQPLNTMQASGLTVANPLSLLSTMTSNQDALGIIAGANLAGMI